MLLISGFFSAYLFSAGFTKPAGGGGAVGGEYAGFFLDDDVVSFRAGKGGTEKLLEFLGPSDVVGSFSSNAEGRGGNAGGLERPEFCAPRWG